MKSKSIYIIRHGESDCGGLNHSEYIPDLEGALTGIGIDQAKTLGVLLAKKAIVFDIMYVSPKERAQQTFKVAGDSYFNQRGISMVGGSVYNPSEIRSRSFGLWEKRPKKEVLSPDNEFDYYNNPNFRTPGGESSFEVYKRAIGFFKEITQQDGVIGVISHSKVIECIHRYVSHLQNPRIAPFSFHKYEAENTGVLRIIPNGEEGLPTIEEF